MVDGDGLVIEVASLDGCGVISLAGELDYLTAPALVEAIDAYDGDRPVVVDLSELRFLDSSGLHALMMARSESRTLVIVCPEGNVGRVLSIVRLELALPLYERLDDAVAALHSTRRRTPRLRTRGGAA